MRHDSRRCEAVAIATLGLHDRWRSVGIGSKTAALLVVGGFLVLAGAAQASSSAGVEYGTSKGPGWTGFDGGQGVSAMSALFTSQGKWTLSDPAGVLLGQQSPCTVLDATSVSCPDDESGLRVTGGRTGGTITVDAEQGASASARLAGGPGNDTLRAGPGISADFVLSSGSDVIAGEPTRSYVTVPSTWTDRPVDVDLAGGIARHGSDVTQMNGQRWVTALAPATIHGTTEADHVHLEGGFVTSGDGPDTLGGWGHFDAGAGNDLITTHGVANITCGPGADRVIPAAPGSTLAGDCEQLLAFGPKYETTHSGIDPRPHLVPRHPGQLRLSVFCGPPLKSCRGTLTLRLGRSHRTTAFNVSRNTSRWIVVRIPGKKPALLGARAALTLTIEGYRDPTWTAPVVR